MTGDQRLGEVQRQGDEVREQQQTWDRTTNLHGPTSYRESLASDQQTDDRQIDGRPTSGAIHTGTPRRKPRASTVPDPKQNVNATTTPTITITITRRADASYPIRNSGHTFESLDDVEVGAVTRRPRCSGPGLRPVGQRSQGQQPRSNGSDAGTLGPPCPPVGR